MMMMMMMLLRCLEGVSLETHSLVVPRLPVWVLQQLLLLEHQMQVGFALMSTDTPFFDLCVCVCTLDATLTSDLKLRP